MEMKKYLILFLFFSTACYAQTYTSMSFFSGLNISKFNIPGYSETTAIPAGFSLQYGGVFKGGVQYSTNAFSPYKYKAYETASSTSTVYKQSIIQHDISIIVTIEFAPTGAVDPYISGGVGAYFGKMKTDYASPVKSIESKFEPTFGWHGGFGFNFRLGSYDESPKFFIEGSYSSVSFKSQSDDFKFDAKSMGLRSGFRFLF